MFDARGFTGFLHVHAEVDQVDQHLHVALRLEISPHDAEHQVRPVVLGHHRGDDRVERAFVRLQAVEVFVVEGE